MAQRPQHFSTRQRMSRNTFEVFHYKDNNMTEVALHHHDFYEVYFFLSGNVVYNIDSRSYQLCPGDILLIGPSELHQPVFSEDRKGYERMVLWLNASFLEQFDELGQAMSGCFGQPGRPHNNLLHTDSTTRELLAYLFGQLIAESRSEEFGANLYSMGCLAQVLVVINRLALRADREAEPRENADSTVLRVLTYINEHYQEDLSLDDLANRFFISKYHLSREFNRVVGSSVYRYIIQKRLIMARQLIASGVPTSTVYQQCGFGDYSNFYRAFKGEYQMSPREYLDNLKKESTARQEAGRLRSLTEP